jgi:alpha-galactosidase
LDHEKEDAEDLAAWDVDYFKYDNCYNLGRMGSALVSFNRYKAMADALNATGRPMVYSLCSWGEDYVHSVGRKGFLIFLFHMIPFGFFFCHERFHFC